MEHSNETLSSREDLRVKLRASFDGKIVRKDLTKKIKEGARACLKNKTCTRRAKVL